VKAHDHIANVGRWLRTVYPEAIRYGVQSSDQNQYGYRLTYVALPDGLIIDRTDAAFDRVGDELDDMLGDLDWGSFGDRGIDTDFGVSFETGRMIR